jgi:hypothetical protein
MQHGLHLNSKGKEQTVKQLSLLKEILKLKKEGPHNYELKRTKVGGS